MLTVIVLGMVAMWGYVVYLAFGPGRSGPPDRLEDPAFSRAAEQRCGEALDAVAALPPATEMREPAERAGVLDEANEHFTAMVGDLDELVDLAAPGEDREIVREWLADWRVYLGDREDYAAQLRRGEDTRFTVSAKGGQQITDYLEEFAKDNAMPACSVPLDV